ncbi:hypothetical protein ABG067_005292 [Albugo candida]
MCFCVFYPIVREDQLIFCSTCSSLKSILRVVFVALCPSLLALVCVNDPKLLHEFKTAIRSFVSSFTIDTKTPVDQVEKRAVQQLQVARDELYKNVDEMCFVRTGSSQKRTKILAHKHFADRNGPFNDTEKTQVNTNSWNSTRKFVRQWLRPHQRHGAEDVDPDLQSSNPIHDMTHSLPCSLNSGTKKTLYDEVDLHLLDHEFFAPPKELPSTRSLSFHPRYAISEVPVYFMEPTTRMYLKVTNNHRVELTSDPDVSCLFNIVKGKTHHWGFQSTVTQRYLGQNVVGKVVTAARKFNSWESFRVLEIVDEEERSSDNHISLRCSKPIYFVLCSGRFGKGMWLAKSRRQRRETVVQSQADASSRQTTVTTGSVYLSRNFRAAMALRYASNIAAFGSIPMRTRQTARVFRVSDSEEGSETESGSELKEEFIHYKNSISNESDGYEDKLSGLEESESFEIEYSEKPDDVLDEVDDVGSSCEESAANTNGNELYTSEEDLMDRILSRSALGEYSLSTPIVRMENETCINLLEYITLYEDHEEEESFATDKTRFELEPQEFLNVQCYDILALCIGTIAPEHSNWQSHSKRGYVRRLLSFPLAEMTSASTEGMWQRMAGVEHFQSLTFLPTNFEKDGFVLRTTLYTTNFSFSNIFGVHFELKFIPSTANNSQSTEQTKKTLESSQYEEVRRLRVEARTSLFWTRRTSAKLSALIEEAVQEGTQLFYNELIDVVRRASDLEQTGHGGIPAALRMNLLKAMQALAPVRSLMERRFDLILAHLLNIFGVHFELKFIPSTANNSQSTEQTKKTLESSQYEEVRRLRVEARTSLFWTRRTSAKLSALIEEAVQEGTQLFYNELIDVVRRASDLEQTGHGGIPAALRMNLLKAMQALAPVRSLMERRFDLILAHLLSCSIVKALVQHSEIRLSHFDSFSWACHMKDSRFTDQLLESSVDKMQCVVNASMDLLITPQLFFEILFSNASTFAQRRRKKGKLNAIDSDDNITAWMHTLYSLNMEKTRFRDMMQDGIRVRKQSYEVLLSNRNGSGVHPAVAEQYDHYRIRSLPNRLRSLELGVKVSVPCTKSISITIEIAITIEQPSQESAFAIHTSPNLESRIRVAFAAPYITSSEGSEIDQTLTVIDGAEATECLRNGIAEIWEPIVEIMNLAAVQGHAAATLLPGATDHQDKVLTEHYRSVILLQLLRKQMYDYREASVTLMKKCIARIHIFSS